MPVMSALSPRETASAIARDFPTEWRSWCEQQDQTKGYWRRWRVSPELVIGAPYGDAKVFARFFAWLQDQGKVLPGPGPSPNPPTPGPDPIPVPPTPPVPPGPDVLPPAPVKVVRKMVHKQARVVRDLLRIRAYPFLWGAPGAGKTHLCQTMANQMGLDFVIVACSRDMLASILVGSKSPLTGEYFPQPFRKAWEEGGFCLLDECANAPGTFLNVLNGALEQKVLRFPDGRLVKMHPNFFLVCADNTAGYGNDPLFPEREDMGGAFRDRLAYVDFDYDDSLQEMILQSILGDAAGSLWHRGVLQLRANLKNLEIPVFASPRMAFLSAKMLSGGSMTWEEVLNATLWRGQPEDVRQLARQHADSIRRFAPQRVTQTADAIADLTSLLEVE